MWYFDILRYSLKYELILSVYILYVCISFIYIFKIFYFILVLSFLILGNNVFFLKR